MRLQRTESLLVIVDVQEKLMPVIDRADAVIANIARLVRAAKVMDLPVVLTEQYSKGLGHTMPDVKSAFDETFGYQPIEKATFSAYGAGEFVAALRLARRKQILIAGVETHVCVYQTVSDLLAAGYEVTLLTDAMSSRTAANKEIAIQRMAKDGAKLSSTEMALFEMTVTSATAEFKAISKLVK